MITVVCVCWGKKFSLDYVYNLRAMVERNTTVKHKFVVFSDKTVPDVETKILRPGYDGWWNKIQLFDNEHGLTSRVVYFDLDTLITGNIDWLMNYRGLVMGIEDLGSVNKHQPHLIGRFQSGVMAWHYRACHAIWESFKTKPDLVSRFRGDGEYLNEALPVLQRDLIQQKYPGQLKSYKYQVYNKGLDKNTSIVCFHGRPSIEQAINKTVTTPYATFEKRDWVKDYWKR